MARDKKKHRFEPVGDIVSIYQRGGRWYANFQMSGQQHRKALGTTSKKEARRRAVQLEAEILQGRYQRTLPPPALASVIEDYQRILRTEGRAKRTLAKYDKIFERLRDLADRRRVRTLNEVTLKLLDAYRAERVEAGAAAKTVYTEATVLRPASGRFRRGV